MRKPNGCGTVTGGLPTIQQATKLPIGLPVKDHKMHLGDWVKQISSAAMAIICSFALALGCNARSTETEATVRELFRDFRPYNTERIRGLTEHQRSLMLDVLRDKFTKEREQMKDGKLEPSYASVVFEMALIGDDQALKEYCYYFLAFESRSNPVKMLLLCSPKAIPLIGEALFKEEHYEVPGDVGLLPTQSTVANIILQTVSIAPEFSKDAASWAGRALSAPRGVDIKQLRTWYRENEAKLRAWDFKAIQPGEEPPVHKLPSAANVKSTTPPIETPPRSEPKALDAPSTLDRSPGGFYWLLAFVLTIGGGIIWLMTRKAK